MARARTSLAERERARQSNIELLHAALRVRRPSRSRSRADSTASTHKKRNTWKLWGWKVTLDFNFILIHYLYIIAMSLLVSFVLMAGNIEYIDAFFFATGASTQSGLNTIDINNLLLYQQVVLMLTACLTTPVFINTVVVFVRLYMFHRRFKGLVRKARENQKSWAKSRSKSEAKAEPDLGRLEQGVNGRDIKILRSNTAPNSNEKSGLHGTENNDAKDINATVKSASSNSSTNQGGSTDGSHTLGGEHHDEETIAPLHHRAITFPDHLPAPHHDSEQANAEQVAPEDLDISQHIAIVKRQQEAAKARGGTLRIPGPRDYDRGEVPEEIQSAQLAPVRRRDTGESGEVDHVTRMLSQNSEQGKFNADDHPVRRGITINEPAERPKRTLDTAATLETPVEPFSPIKHTLMRLISPLSHHGRTSTDTENHGFLHRTITGISNTFTGEPSHDQPYLSTAATIGRNSAFVNLTEEQREELGGIEYRSLKLLAKILVCYYVGFHIFGMLVYLPWIIYTQPWRDIVVADGVDPAWWGIFTAASMFNDLGFTLTPDSMISFQTAVLILLIGSFLIIIGNTGFPVMLRFVIWCFSKCIPKGSPTWEELRFLLDHPRRCFTLLFPSRANWILFGILFGLNAIDLIFFCTLDIGDPIVTSMPAGIQVLNGWFQAASTRTAGFSSVNIAALKPGIQVSYLIMMYISVLPIAMSVRRTNVYEEASLGVYDGGKDDIDMNSKGFIGQHLRRQLSFDLWYVFAGFFIIANIEGTRLAAQDDPAFSLFAVLFEIISAYGTVGLSLGYPTVNTSFSSQLHTASKIIIALMMIRGRHRGLPYALDRAILLPSEERFMKESEEASRRYNDRRRNSIGDGVGRRHTWAADEDGDDYIDGVDPLGANGRVGSRLTRRGSNVSGISNRTNRETFGQRGRNFAKFLASGLSAGPTISKHD